eukprot:m.62757 g.62757  ORF g.62757 m.62757 type:complete len:467 (+) comp8111_c0_seq1:326-1726(+)
MPARLPRAVWPLITVCVFGAGVLVGTARHRTLHSGSSNIGEAVAAHGVVGVRSRRDAQAVQPGNDRNLAYWDSAAATALEIKEMVKTDLRQEYGLDEQGETLMRLLKTVRNMQNQKHAWETRIRTTAAPTPHKKPTCVNNPPMHFERTGDLIRECKTYQRSHTAESPSWVPQQAFVLSLKPPSDPNVASRVAYLEKQGLTAAAFPAVNGASEFASMYGEAIDEDTGNPVTTYTDPRQPDKVLRRHDDGFLTAGERGYLATMQRILESALQNGTESIVVLDDDAVLDCAFKSALAKVLADDRCSAPIRPSLAGAGRAGVLLLGAAIWIDGTYPERGAYSAGWRVTDAEMAALRDVHDRPPLCYNAHSKTFGSFAAVYHHSSFRAILDWIGNTSEPFDHVYPALVKAQRLVRVAHPSLVIQDVGHTSQIDPSRQGQHNFSWRANIHRWEPVGRYCDPVSGLPVSHNRR